MGRGTRGLAIVLALAFVGGGGCTISKEAPEEAAEVHIGDVMDGVGRRFERLGRAALANRWEFAAYQAHEIEESVEKVPTLEPPEGVNAADLKRLAEAFLAVVPTLERALAARDSAAFRAAFRETAAACNQCHRNAGRRFVEIPDLPGVEVPTLTPVSGSAADSGRAQYSR